MNEADAFLFFMAGYETTSTIVSFCLLELALKPAKFRGKAIQAEIDEVADNNPDGFTLYKSFHWYDFPVFSKISSARVTKIRF